MRNTQRVDSLLVITSDIARINQIVAQSHDWELKELDDFLEEYVEGDKLKKILVFLRSRLKKFMGKALIF